MGNEDFKTIGKHEPIPLLVDPRAEDSEVRLVFVLSAGHKSLGWPARLTCSLIGVSALRAASSIIVMCSSTVTVFLMFFYCAYLICFLDNHHDFSVWYSTYIRILITLNFQLLCQPRRWLWVGIMRKQFTEFSQKKVGRNQSLRTPAQRGPTHEKVFSSS